MRLKDENNIEVLVNKTNWLSKEFIPVDLIVPKVKFLPDTNGEAMFLRKESAKALEKLFKSAKKEKIELYAVSGYRSYKRQSEIFKNNLKKDGKLANKYSARPGQSEHQTGLAIDVTCKDVDFNLVEEFEGTAAYLWLFNNAHKYGFVLRYSRGKEEITGYIFEPWHLRYVGKELAYKLYTEEITLEEYYKNK